MSRYLRDKFQKEPENQQRIQELWRRSVVMAGERQDKGLRTSAKDIYYRNLSSLWKTELHWRWGGAIWWQLLCILGRALSH